jgi:MerR family transcriptional regulator, thiopeptide resistance regulator
VRLVDVKDSPGLPVGEVARLAGVTVRTLHHYDEIGLLRPSHRTPAGYRQYDQTDLLRLQRILAYRELGFGLDQVAGLVEGATVDGATVAGPDELARLRQQRDLIVRRIERLQQVLAAVETTMEARTMGIELTPQEILEVFGDDDPTQYADEAAERWGDTDAYQESRRRTRSYSKADWQRIAAEQAGSRVRYAATMAAGHPPTSAEAMDAAEAHRLMISRWFYDCGPAMHRGLGDMYVCDARFTVHYDEAAPGLAQWVRDAIHANADRMDTDAGDTSD